VNNTSKAGHVIAMQNFSTTKAVGYFLLSGSVEGQQSSRT